MTATLTPLKPVLQTSANRGIFKAYKRSTFIGKLPDAAVVCDASASVFECFHYPEDYETHELQEKAYKYDLFMQIKHKGRIPDELTRVKLWYPQTYTTLVELARRKQSRDPVVLVADDENFWQAQAVLDAVAYLAGQAALEAVDTVACLATQPKPEPTPTPELKTIHAPTSTEVTVEIGSEVRHKNPAIVWRYSIDEKAPKEPPRRTGTVTGILFNGKIIEVLWHDQVDKALILKHPFKAENYYNVVRNQPERYPVDLLELIVGV